MKRHPTLLDRSPHELFRSARSWSDVVEGARDVRLADNEFIHALAVGSTLPLAEALNERAFTGLREIHARDTISLFSYRRRFGRKDQHQVSGEFLTVRWDDGPIYLMVYAGAPSFLRWALNPLLDRVYPKVARPFLTQQELHDLLRTVQKAVQPDQLRIQEYSAKRRLRSPARRRFESVRDWTDVEADTAFREAKERNVWFRSVRFEIVRSDEPGPWEGMHGRLSKYGHVSVDSGFDLVNRAVLPQLIRVTSERLKLFSNRDRVSAPHHNLMPLEVTYDRAVLEQPDDLKRLLDGLMRFPHGTCTVLHANPYLHVALVDNRDFSAADVWVLSENSILIVPQLRASHAALKRLVNHIFENFAEGRVGEPKTL